MKLGTTSWLIGENFLDNARLVAGQVDFVELLVYTWDRDMRAKVISWLEPLAALDLEYTVHLPTDSAEKALAAALFFQESGFPLLNMTLHPFPGWQQLPWPSLVAVENLIDRIEFHPRFTYDLTHSLLGITLPDHYHPHIVELHLSGTDGHVDHLALDATTLRYALPYLTKEMLVCIEIFNPRQALDAVEMLRTLSPRG
ncbi:hypothetical protein [Desulfobulbus alkaliphilus]|uniref:hypothetical protein n=1 Tax=Desulfobulbus alkaliphilus TaxID=869814 RepID=UPI00196531CF|nr:hypothetical protein [Desulfobulbus alkaliphilus]MBM9536906.1 hypothetical protein [Desulfobulbus alkaliphilus]